MKWILMILPTISIILITIVIAIGDPTPNSITHEGLEFVFNPDGYIEIYNGEGLVSRYGFGLTGDVANTSYVRTTEDFSWSKSYQNITLNFTKEIEHENGTFENITTFYQKQVMTFYNNKPNFNWTITMVFDEMFTGAKTTHTIHNDLGEDITDTKFWYLFQVREGYGFFYKDKWYGARPDRNYHFTENLTRFKEIDFYHFLFDWDDLIRSGYNITDLYLGDGELIGRPDKTILAIGVTKNDGLFPDGTKGVLDPTITTFHSPNDFSNPVGQWLDPENLATSDDSYASETTLFEIQDTNNYTFNLPFNSTIHGIEMALEGKAGFFFPCVARTTVTIARSFSVDGGTTFGDIKGEGKFDDYDCVESIITSGALNDTWGLGILNETHVTDDNLVLRLNFTERGAAGGTVVMDHVKVRLNFTGDVFNMSIEEPQDNSFIGSIFNVTANSTTEISTCKVELNVTGSFVNHSMNVGIMTCSQILFNFPNGTTFDFRVHGIPLGGGAEVTTEFRTVTVDNTAPIVVIHSPENNTLLSVAHTLINFTVTELEDPWFDVIVYAYTNISHKFKSIVFQREKQINGTTFDYNLTITPKSYSAEEDPNMTRLYHFDNNLTILDETGHRNGTAFGDTLFNPESGKMGGAFFYDGADDKIKIGEAGDFEFNEMKNGFTISVWAFLNGTGSLDVLVSRWDTTGANAFFQFSVLSGNSVGSLLSDDGFFDGSSCINEGGYPNNGTGKWNNFVMVFNGTTTKVYEGGINRTDWASCTQPLTGGWDNDEDTCIAIDCDDDTNDFHGTIDEVIIWQRALSDLEIRNLYEINSGRYFIDINVSDHVPNDEGNPELTHENNTQFRYCSAERICTAEGCDIPCGLGCILTSDDVDIAAQDINMIGSGNCTFNMNITGFGKWNLGKDCRSIVTAGHSIS